MIDPVLEQSVHAVPLNIPLKRTKPAMLKRMAPMIVGPDLNDDVTYLVEVVCII